MDKKTRNEIATRILSMLTPKQAYRAAIGEMKKEVKAFCKVLNN